VFGITGDADLKSSTPDSGSVIYQTIKTTDLTTIVFSIAYNPAGNDTLTVWLNPDFGVEAGSQTANRTTTFTGNFSFDNIRLREGGAGNGWNFSNISVATTPTEIGFVPEPSAVLLGGIGLLCLLRRRREAA
jgi:hypothetical protein